MVSEELHSVYDAAKASVESELSELTTERAAIAEKIASQRQELAALEGELPFKWQQFRSKQLSLFDVHRFEADARAAKRALLVLRKQLKLCDMRIGEERKAAAQQRLDAIGPQLPSLLAEQAALLDELARAERAMRNTPSEIGALDRSLDALDAEDAEQRSRTLALAASQEAHRLAHAT